MNTYTRTYIRAQDWLSALLQTPKTPQKRETFLKMFHGRCKHFNDISTILQKCYLLESILKHKKTSNI